jgi:hypothetical protein
MVNLPEKSADRRLRKTTGSLGLEEELDLSKVERGERVLVAQLIALLVSFMGEALTVLLAQESWAEVRAQDLDP